MKQVLLLFQLLLLSSVDAFVSPGRSALRIDAIHTNVCRNPGSRLNSIADAVEDAHVPSRSIGLTSCVIRVANHAPAFLSLFYFGLVSMSSMMPDVMPLKPTLASVLTQNVGPTTNRLFADYFPTLVTPPSFIFLVWPTIVVVQIATLVFSALQPIKKQQILSQDNLTALSISNLAATWWLIVASQTSPGRLKLASCLVLPLVPFFSGYPLRKMERSSAMEFKIKSAIFQLYSSFTTIASLLALTVELQHGGRVPKLSAEAAASVFLGLYFVIVSMKNKSGIKKLVQAGAITGIAVKRVQDCIVRGSYGGVSELFMSVSFLGTIFVSFTAIQKLVERA
jgi:hypothetical protein